MASTAQKTAAPALGSATISVKLLHKAMRDMIAVIERRNTVPILSCVLISVGPSTMTLTATDLDVWLVRQLDLEAAGQGKAMAIAVDGATLEKICGKLPGDAQMRIEQLDGGKIEIKAGRSRFTLPTLPATDFPSSVTRECKASFEMPRALLQQLFEAVAFAQSNEPSRYYLNGIFLHFDGAEGEAGALKAAATDGHRLALMSIDAPDGAEAMADLDAQGVIVGRKTVGVLNSLLDHDDCPTIQVDIAPTQISIEIGTVTLTAKLIDGSYPDYRTVIPSANPRSVWLDPKACSDAAERALVVATGKTRSVRLDLGEGLVKVSAASPEYGSAEEEIEATIEGGPLAIGFNGAYLREVLNRLTASPALLRMGEEAAAPVLVMDAEDSRRRFVLMPMRV